MNLLLLKEQEETSILVKGSAEYLHLTGILKVRSGQVLETGVWQGMRGRSIVTAVDKNRIILKNHWFSAGGNPGYPVTLVIGCCRPIQAKRILREATALGVRKIVWAITDNTTRSYTQSSLWQKEQWQGEVREGAIQAFTNIGPIVIPPLNLDDYLSFEPTATVRLVLDNYEATLALPQFYHSCTPPASVELWIGPERGWSQRERNLFRTRNLSLVHLGSRVLKTETACLTAIAQTLPLFPEFHRSHAEFERCQFQNSPHWQPREYEADE